ncbi:hypothetical protein [Alteromonas sp. KUL49]|uniref:hypothetical protein n=1 Tax=Alteromonas sp. KUL49 TaxID=2480798 RepID=UPI00102EE950|nr:hypothetical protein [Alteromonas sp. KUL49]TAP38738.1 hypothetical protein EYS00_15155 [Alteromonas sp. KUL49]GEA12693.1 hypothetical protein KUL49_30680 [Alteromonas sp. KUL49]
MDGIPSTAFIGIGAIVAAVITGTVALLSVVIAKDQKTSEFRQNWIDSLRIDVADYLGYFMQLQAVRLNCKATGQNFEDFGGPGPELYQRLHALFIRINLRLNPSEHSKLASKLKELDLIAESNNSLEQAQNVIDLHAEIMVLTHGVLSDEWKRVKSGESWYVFIRYLILMVTFLFATVFPVIYMNYVG